MVLEKLYYIQGRNLVALCITAIGQEEKGFQQFH
jgi:hypothetical protein